MEESVWKVKRIHRTTQEMEIISLDDAESASKLWGSSDPGQIRSNLERFGSLMIGNYIYHMITSDSMVDMLGKSIRFEFKDGTVKLIKVQMISFDYDVCGFDDEMNQVEFHLDDVSAYYPKGVAVIR